MFIVALFLGIILVFEITFILGCLTFWISETDYFRGAIENLSLILGGLWVPVTFFPKEILKILDYLPFKYQYYFPVAIFQGKVMTGEIMRGLIIESIWIVILFFVLKTTWANGIKKYEGYGN